MWIKITGSAFPATWRLALLTSRKIGFLGDRDRDRDRAKIDSCCLPPPPVPMFVSSPDKMNDADGAYYIHNTHSKMIIR